MAGQYERFHDDDVTASGGENVSTSGSEDGTTDHVVTSQVQPADLPNTGGQRSQRIQFMEGQWPTQVGCVHLVFGFLLTFLGLVQVLALPLAEDSTGTFNIFHLSRQNIFGCGIWAGLLLILSGTVALRAAIYHNITAIYLFFLLTILQILVYTGMMFLVLISYSENWITPTAYDHTKGSGVYFGLQVAISCCIGVSVLLVLHVFTKYCETVVFGELQLCRHWLHCCAPCWCPRVVEQEELADENIAARPPSLPV